MIIDVTRKELRDHWRDRRSVLGALILPAVGPLMLLLVFHLVAERTGEQKLEIAIEGRANAPHLVVFLEQQGATIVDAPADPEAAVRSAEVPFVLRIAPDFRDELRQSELAQVDLVVDASNQNAIRSRARVERLVAAYSQRIAMQRMLMRGMVPAVAQPIGVREVDLATPRQSAAQLLGIIPLLLVLMAFVGGMNVAIDTTAGERERGSLEPLLLNPVSRFRLVVGKWLATSVFALGVLLVGLIGFVVAANVVPHPDIGFAVSFGPMDAAAAAALLVPLALLGSAIQMVVAMFARTFKEAQTYLSLFNLVPMSPAIYLMFESKSAELWMAVIPAMGQIAATLDILRGDEIPVGYVPVVWCSSVVLCVGCLLLLSWLLGREKVIYGR